ncbi:MAG: hypothetical protein KDA81_07940 [Planctomycetaceae bacterium]|nr:hypothetical protein [Planctomycetaceae bacterium]
MPDAGVLATILLIVGLFLLALELMIPSFGMIGIMSALTLLISAWCAWQAWWGTSPGFFWTYAGFWLLGIPSILGGTLFLLQNTRLGDRIVLRGTAYEHGGMATERRRLESLIGATGQTVGMLTPGGLVAIDGERFHAESAGVLIESGETVHVVKLKGNRLVVRAGASRESRPGRGSSVSADSENPVVASENVLGGEQRTTGDSDELDFEIPDEYRKES